MVRAMHVILSSLVRQTYPILRYTMVDNPDCRVVDLPLFVTALS
jgi:hypothetical protein